MGIAVNYTPPTVDVTPADHATDVKLDTPVTIHTSVGTLESVQVGAIGDPQPLAGHLDRTQRTWTSTDGLDNAAHYTISAVAVDGAGNTTTVHSAFSTISAYRLTSTVTPADGQTVGVGMPVKIRFSSPVAVDHENAVLSHITVDAAPPAPGAWHWFSQYEVHYRPQDYWATGTHISVTANLKGVDIGGNVWGMGNWSASFTVGPKHVSIIDAASHTMQVFANDQPVYTWPISAGRPDRPTLSGTLVVWYKQQDVLMDSLTLGIPRNSPDGYYEHVFWDTAISTDGFFVHAAPWSVYAQGRANVSHGCVNLSTDRAITFFGFSNPGDVVIVKNTSRPADSGDGEGDWQIPFAQFANSGGEIPHTITNNAGGL